MTVNRARILIVEDDEYQYRIYRMILDGYDVEFASNLEEAEAELRSTGYDLVIFDLRLQSDHPAGAAGAVKDTKARISDVLKESLNPSIPFVIMSAYLDEVSKEDLSKEESIYDHEQLRAVQRKGGDINDLREAVRQVLQEPPHSAFSADERLRKVFQLVSDLERRTHHSGHSENVRRIAACISRRLGLISVEIQAVEILGGLHDTEKLGIGKEVGELFYRSWEMSSLAEASRLVAKLIVYPEQLALQGAFRPRAGTVGHFYERWASNREPCAHDDRVALIAEIIAAADAAEVFSRARKGVIDATEVASRVAHLLGRTFSDKVLQALAQCCKE